MGRQLEQQVAIITGGATGIGRASALLFAAEGAAVAVADINLADAEKTASDIRRAGGRGMALRCDVTTVSDIQAAVRETVAQYGKLTIYFSNAGVAGPGALSATTEAAWDKAIDVNLKGAYFGAQAAAPEIAKAGGGCLLFTSSGLGLRPSPASPSYSMAKAALVMLARCLAVSLGKDNIRANALCPGPVSGTPMWHDFTQRVPGTDPEKYLKQAVGERPLPRVGTVEEVAQAALFLVSPANAYITGVALPVDGGGAAR
jgi:NAD(P)-dependent dehydrogenase (short-subunit alcohol dehydrogenase family)